MAAIESHPTKRVKFADDIEPEVYVNDILKIQFGDYCCNPLFTHQFFPDEKVTGWFKPSIQMTYHPSSLELMDVTIEHEGTFHDENRLILTLTENLASVLNGVRIKSKNRLEETPSEKPFSSITQQQFKPPGNIFQAYSQIKNTDNLNSSFKVFLSQPSESLDISTDMKFHEQCQKLALFFIDGASEIDFTDKRWEIFYCFEEVEIQEVQVNSINKTILTVEYKFVGFFTVFNFLFGSKMRICQALVSPQYQRQGHGNKLYSYIMELARVRQQVIEVTVEDPAPGFVKLRDGLDFLYWCEKAHPKEGSRIKSNSSEGLSKEVEPSATETITESTNTISNIIESAVEHENFTLTKVQLSTIQQKTKLTNQQIVLCFEAYCLHSLSKQQKGDDSVDEEQKKKLRLAIKRRLREEHIEEINALEGKEERIKLLAEHYEAYEKRLLDMVNRAKREGNL